jgi:hypothetical protein
MRPLYVFERRNYDVADLKSRNARGENRRLTLGYQADICKARSSSSVENRLGF